MIIFRKSTYEDLEQMEKIAQEGKALLKSKGIDQWQRGTYPDKVQFKQDIEDGAGYVLSTDDAPPEVLAICAFIFTGEVCYTHLESGQWLTGNTQNYAVIHRCAVAKKHQGHNLSGLLFAEAAKIAKSCNRLSIRIDTHPQNKTMHNTLIRAGFVKCTEFYLREGDEAGGYRYGYELLL